MNVTPSLLVYLNEQPWQILYFEMAFSINKQVLQISVSFRPFIYFTESELLNVSDFHQQGN